MSVINSDLGNASLKATALKEAIDTINQATAAVPDTQTTVMGNQKAVEAIILAHDTAQKIASSVSLASANIQSVAENFEALDQQVAQTLRQNIGDLF